jgi:polyhydroxyalkanoate synthesis regulator phasin
MAEPGSNGYIRDLAERMVLGGVGALALTADRVDALVDALVTRGGMQRDEARSVVDDVTGRWRTEAKRVGRAGTSAHGLFRELGLVTKADVEELELRIAQLEHRLRLVEAAPRGDSV